MLNPSSQTIKIYTNSYCGDHGWFLYVLQIGSSKDSQSSLLKKININFLEY